MGAREDQEVDEGDGGQGVNDILRPITEAGDIGYDQFDQLIVQRQQGEYRVQTISSDLREATCAICLRGWELNAEAWSDHIWNSTYEEHVHESCLVRYRARRDREIFFDHFYKARVRFEGMKPIPNGYHTRGRWAERPWYRVPLIEHPVDFLIGLRKRVVNIEVHPREDATLDWWEVAQNAFAGEDVTKGFSPTRIFVHAWNEEKEREYVRWLVKAGQLQVKRD